MNKMIRVTTIGSSAGPLMEARRAIMLGMTLRIMNNLPFRRSLARHNLTSRISKGARALNNLDSLNRFMLIQARLRVLAATD